MKPVKPVGLQAASRKYDLLTALGVHACHGDKNSQRLILRFITLIVARYNWQHDELSVGQREIASLWGVDERTVKRDMAKLRDLGWLVTRRNAARGRVAVHGLDLHGILATTQAAWTFVGPDFTDRMQPGQGAAAAQDNVVPFRPLPAALPEPASAWDRVCRRLQTEDPALFEVWFRQLQAVPGPDATFELRAPSRFHATFVNTHHALRLQAALRSEGLAAQSITVTAAQDA